MIEDTLTEVIEFLNKYKDSKQETSRNHDPAENYVLRDAIKSLQLSQRSDDAGGPANVIDYLKATADTLNNTCNLHDVALYLLEKALEVLNEYADKPPHLPKVNAALLHVALGDTSQKLHRYNKAMIHCNAAVMIYEQEGYESNHPLVMEVKRKEPKVVRCGRNTSNIKDYGNRIYRALKQRLCLTYCTSQKQTRKAELAATISALQRENLVFLKLTPGVEKWQLDADGEWIDVEKLKWSTVRDKLSQALRDAVKETSSMKTKNDDERCATTNTTTKNQGRVLEQKFKDCRSTDEAIAKAESMIQFVEYTLAQNPNNSISARQTTVSSSKSRNEKSTVARMNKLNVTRTKKPSSSTTEQCRNGNTNLKLMQEDDTSVDFKIPSSHGKGRGKKQIREPIVTPRSRRVKRWKRNNTESSNSKTAFKKQIATTTSSSPTSHQDHSLNLDQMQFVDKNLKEAALYLVNGEVLKERWYMDAVTKQNLRERFI